MNSIFTCTMLQFWFKDNHLLLYVAIEHCLFHGNHIIIHRYPLFGLLKERTETTSCAMLQPCRLDDGPKRQA